VVREPNEQLAAVMSRAGCSHKGLARRVCQVGAEHGVELRYDHVAVGRWLDGTQPRGLAAHFLAMALSRKLGEPVEPRDIGMARGSVTALSTVEYAEHTSDALDQVTGLLHSDLAGQSQHVPQLRPEAWNELMVRWLLAPDDHDDPIERDQPTQVTAAAIEAVRVTTDVFSKLDYQFGGGHARLAVLHYVNTDVTPLVRSADPESPLGRELLAAAAALLRLVGWTAYDTGLHGMAQRYLAQALRLADAAGDRMLGGRILAGMSHQANFLGYHDHAADLARAAKKGARASATPTAMALFSAMEARALAAKGDPAGCLSALTRAEKWLERRAPQNDPQWLIYFDEAELAAEFAHCFRDLGRGADAEKWARQSVAASESFYVRSLSFCRTVLATSYIQQGDVEQGLFVATEVVATTAALRSARCRSYVRDFLNRLDAFPRQPEVLDFVQQVRQTLPASG